MTTQPTTVTVRIGVPLDDLPAHLGGPGRPADHWTAIAEACRRYPGKWRAINLSLSADRRKKLPGAIRTGQLAAFTRGDWDAALRRGVLYIRFLGDHESPARGARPSFVLIDEAEEG